MRIQTVNSPALRSTRQSYKVSKTISFSQGQAYIKIRHRQLGPSTLVEEIGKRIYIWKLVRATISLNPVFRVSNIRPCSTAPFRHVVHVTTHEDDDDEFYVCHICAVCSKPLDNRRGRATHYDSIAYACISHSPSSCPHSCHA
jgi:hypothetical protein